MDKEIMRAFRANAKKLRWEVGDMLNSGDTCHQLHIMSRVLSLSGKSRQMLCPQLNPEYFTIFMSELQLETSKASRVEVIHFQVPDSFKDTLSRAIKNQLAHKESSGTRQDKVGHAPTKTGALCRDHTRNFGKQ